MLLSIVIWCKYLDNSFIILNFIRPCLVSRTRLFTKLVCPLVRPSVKVFFPSKAYMTGLSLLPLLKSLLLQLQHEEIKQKYKKVTESLNQHEEAAKKAQRRMEALRVKLNNTKAQLMDVIKVSSELSSISPTFISCEMELSLSIQLSKQELYRFCPSVGISMGPSVSPSVGHSKTDFKSIVATICR